MAPLKLQLDFKSAGWTEGSGNPGGKQACATQTPPADEPVWMLTSLAVTPAIGGGSIRLPRMTQWSQLQSAGHAGCHITTEAPITIQVICSQRYDNCNCTAAGANRPGMTAKNRTAITTHSTIDQNGTRQL